MNWYKEVTCRYHVGHSSSKVWIEPNFCTSQSHTLSDLGMNWPLQRLVHVPFLEALHIFLITCHTAQMREDAEVMAWLQAAWLGFWTHQAALLAVRWWHGIPTYWSSRSKLAQEEVWFYHSGGKNHEEPIFHLVLRCFGKPGAPTKRGVLLHRLHRVHRVHRGDETRWAGRRGIRKALATWHRSGTAVSGSGRTRSGSTRAGWFWWFSRRPSKNQKVWSEKPSLRRWIDTGGLIDRQRDPEMINKV